MKPHALYLPSLVLAALGGLVAVVSIYAQPVRASLVWPMTLIEAGVTATLFLRMLLDPQCRRGIEAAKTQTPFHVGGPVLQTVRTMLWVLFLVTWLLWISGSGGADIALLTCASFAVTIMLSLIHMGLNKSAAG